MRALEICLALLAWVCVAVAAEGIIPYGEEGPQPYPCTSEHCPQPFSNGYMSLEQLNWYLDALENATDKVEVITTRYSSTGNKFLMVIVRPYRNAHVRNPVKRDDRDSFWLETGFEANDFLNTEAALFFIYNLVWHCKKNCDVDYYIIPLMNPDGYEYARMYDDQWKKDRVQHGNGCYGISMNRNFPPAQKFNEYGSSDPCSEEYRGRFAASAVEVSTLLGMKYSVPKMKMAVSMPSYGQHILYPQAIQKGNISEIEDFRDIASQFVDKVHSVGGPLYTMGNFAELLGEQSGTSMDYWYYYNLAPYIFTINLSPPVLTESKKYRFKKYPPKNIDTIGSYVFEGVMAMITRMYEIEAARKK